MTIYCAMLTETKTLPFGEILTSLTRVPFTRYTKVYAMCFVLDDVNRALILDSADRLPLGKQFRLAAEWLTGEINELSSSEPITFVTYEDKKHNVFSILNNHILPSVNCLSQNLSNAIQYTDLKNVEEQAVFKTMQNYNSSFAKENGASCNRQSILKVIAAQYPTIYGNLFFGLSYFKNEDLNVYSSAVFLKSMEKVLDSIT